jgi:hypothetical protein
MKNSLWNRLSADPDNTRPLVALPGWVTRLAGLLRVSSWWESKVACALGTAYAIGWMLRIDPRDIASSLLMIFSAMIPGAVYVSLVNDITDIEADRRCGKKNSMAALPSWLRAVALTASILPGFWAAWMFRDCPLTLICYLLNWMVFTLYSVPPARLKVRGAWGVLMDALGSHLLPTLWISYYIAESHSFSLPALLPTALSLWSLALGLRGIIYHQLLDRQRDINSGLSTFATRHDPAAIRRLVLCLVFPTELTALAVCLVFFGALTTLPLLALYVWQTIYFRKRFGQDIVIVGHTGCYHILLSSYYSFYYPVTFLLCIASRSAVGLVFLLLHLILFPNTWSRILRDLWHVHVWKRRKARESLPSP